MQSLPEFFKLEKERQADLIWDGLFIKRSPLSEACQGVLTTLNEIGLSHAIQNRDLNSVRKWFRSFTKDEYVEMVCSF